MKGVDKVEEVLATVQRIKTAAGAAYTTNFFPVESRLKNWIQQQELQVTADDTAAFFARRDRDFFHLYYCATTESLLAEKLGTLHLLRSFPVVTDLIGREGSLDAQIGAFARVGLRPYSKLVRLARAGGDKVTSDPSATFATIGQVSQVLSLLEGSFNRFSDQLPTRSELEEAARSNQVVYIAAEGKIGAFIHFETQGFTSTVRYWVVHPECRDKGFGSRIIRHYFALHPAVKRFVLWVRANNENAVRRYLHFGYAPDGLADHVLANSLIKE